MTPDTLGLLALSQQERRLAVLVTRIPDGAQLLLLERDGILAEADDADHTRLPLGQLITAATDAARSDRSRIATIEAQDWFLHVHAPPPRLLLVGAVHIAQVLAPLARVAGLAVSVIDPRESFATMERFPGTDLVTLWPDEGLRALRVDRHTAIVTLTHDPKLDDPALDIALGSPAFYIGALGSRKTQNSRRARLLEAGFGEDAIARVRGPVGLPIGAIGASEIALSILAEIVAVRRGGALARRSDWPA
ncbi:XdhC family protein [Lichenicola cladoniae]|uniref:XdhC family protein n=1 Tax=Lichenicola cladoniae TaxID=1484109 RepID=A0A6M8HLG0_9PROT|nr:XdhC family protein [Lichenicola cladoniae]NPD68852.1 XdhC family protein [Acetobacteraceae bacterium]QKE89194.1 XdhC family protein [Lichenicola cladoniae]